MQGNMKNGRALPMPFVIQCDAMDGDLLVTLHLFGRAGAWQHEFRAALVAGLRNGLTDGHGGTTPKTVLMLTAEAASGLTIYPLAAPIVIEFVTPVIQRRGNQAIFDPVTLLTGLAARVEGMAWWHGNALCYRPEDVADAARAMLDKAQMAMQEVPFVRSHGQGHTSVGQVGLQGSMRCPPPNALLGALLQFGVQTHLGARTSAGAGRYLLKLEA
ncbi:CRISPR system precrRNA processing endoribonuclease RAMP protein Cas6 [Marinovum sp. KMM 9989]